MLDLNKDVKFVKGVGPNRVKGLNKLGIRTVNDLITYYPRAYEDRSQIKSICDIQDGEKTTLEATVLQGVNVRMLRNRKSIAKAIIFVRCICCITLYVHISITFSNFTNQI